MLQSHRLIAEYSSTPKSTSNRDPRKTRSICFHRSPTSQNSTWPKMQNNDSPAENTPKSSPLEKPSTSPTPSPPDSTSGPRKLSLSASTTKSMVKPTGFNLSGIKLSASEGGRERFSTSTFSPGNSPMASPRKSMRVSIGMTRTTSSPTFTSKTENKNENEKIETVNHNGNCDKKLNIEIIKQKEKESEKKALEENKSVEKSEDKKTGW
eukprot:TRINITY_DN20085_c0_g1_i1.p1 TRINITY_DN20085_c0_g1~~TRINITY_DN20085_c0_g1_i1.p1  ORF type:complete len:209 (+),score=38.91 TRINITY_DN20085_c0_g1_i1:31-657(+)